MSNFVDRVRFKAYTKEAALAVVAYSAMCGQGSQSPEEFADDPDTCDICPFRFNADVIVFRDKDGEVVLDSGCKEMESVVAYFGQGLKWFADRMRRHSFTRFKITTSGVYLTDDMFGLLKLGTSRVPFGVDFTEKKLEFTLSPDDVEKLGKHLRGEVKLSCEDHDKLVGFPLSPFRSEALKAAAEQAAKLAGELEEREAELERLHDEEAKQCALRLESRKKDAARAFKKELKKLGKLAGEPKENASSAAAS